MTSLPTARRKRAQTDPVTHWAERVVAGKVVACRLVVLACKRHIRDLERGPKRGLIWDPERARRGIEFYSWLRHSKGEWGGRTFELEPWQQFVQGSVFGWMRKDGTRRFRVVYEEIPRKNGKALAVDTPVPTPDGWRRHGDLRPGDRVFSPAGVAIPVLAVTGHYAGPCFAVGFGDGTEIIAHARHEWRTSRSWFTGRPHGSRARLPEVETQRIAETLRFGGRGDFTHGIPVAAPLDLPAADLAVPGYTLGAWLGDGHARAAAITVADPEILAGIRADGLPVRLTRAAAASGAHGKARTYRLTDGRLGPELRGLRAALAGIGVWGDKHIPVAYLRASVEQRLALLAGLVDTDGHVTARGQCEVVLVNERLFLGVVELARTLGYKPTVTEDRASIAGVDKGPRYRVQFWPGQELPLRVPRKRERLSVRQRSRSGTRMVVACDPIGDREVNCIEVEGGMYLAGPGMVATHNSTRLAGVGLYGLIADREPGAEIYAAATKKDQARIIWDEAKRMVRSSPDLAERIGVFKSNLSIDATASKFEPLSADEKTLDGLNPHIVLIDELHKHRSRAVLDVLDTALGSRRQPILWMITTAGDDNPESVYAQENDYAIKVLEGLVQDDALFAFITTIDKDDRWDDPRAWAKANPNLGVSVKLDDLKRQAAKAKKSPSALQAFKRLRLNVRTASADRFIDMDTWRENGSPVVDPAALEGRRCYAGLDLSSKIDISAFVKLFPPEDPGDRWIVVPRFWIPADTVEEKADRDQVQYRRWIDEGWIETTAGNVIDHLEIQRAVQEDERLYRLDEVAYDPWNATQLAVGLADHGVPMFEFVQGLRSYTAPTKELEAMLLARRLDHGNNPVLSWMASNLSVQRDKNENYMPTKKHSRGRIDGMSALIMAIGRALLTEGPSPYEERGLLIL